MKRWNTWHLVGLLTLATAGPAPAEELVGGRLVYELLKDGVKQQFTPAVVRKTIQNGATSCEVLEWDRKAFNKPMLSIGRPGKYCLDQDYEFDCAPFAHGCSGELISIRANDVDVDFRGHTLSVSGTREYGGVRGQGRNIRIHHGRIKGAGLGLLLSDLGGSPLSAYPGMPLESGARFADTGYVVEEMEFIDARIAVMLGGAGNQIRNNRIGVILENRFNEQGQPLTRLEAEPQFALLSYGPAARIEGNSLRLTTRTRGLRSLAMYLRAADATLVANNTISVDGTAAGTIGVGISNSSGVVLQSNVMATEKGSELDQRSSLKQE
jgi:hypothetical protein